jgi:tetratricopeptide (TPR) repeat protein
MKDRTEYLEEDESAAINKYTQMVERKGCYYFDVFEFEVIIDFYIDKNQQKSAKEAIEYALRIHPKTISFLQKKAKLLMAEGLPYKALKILNDIVKIENLNSTTHFLIGVVNCSVGEISKALTHFEQAIAIDNIDNEELNLNIATTLEQIGQYEFAVRYFRQVLQVNPENVVALFEMAYCCEKLNLDDQSVKFYRDYLAIDPYSRLAWTNLAGVFCKLEDYPASIDAIEFAIAIDPSVAFSYFQKGFCEVFNQMYEKGIESLDYYICIEPDDADAHYYLGEAYAKTGRYKDAFKSFEKAIVLDQTHSDAYYGIACILFEEKKYTDAYYYIQKAIKIDKDESDYWHISALINNKLGFYEAAEEAYLLAVEIDQQNPQIWIDFSEIGIYRKNVDKRIWILKQAFEHFSDNAEINYRLAANYALIYNKESAVFHLNLALKSEPLKLGIFRTIYKSITPDFEYIIEKYASFSKLESIE